MRYSRFQTIFRPTSIKDNSMDLLKSTAHFLPSSLKLDYIQFLLYNLLSIATGSFLTVAQYFCLQSNPKKILNISNTAIQ